ncbi:GNAT family N-acetyltransferase [Duganella fentianensis]|uniref:GNAT family N-acetyltransferase n=1 Tax=Duganella fentianensis TaxID=2692177 RepID=UPI00280604D0|nr:GNAT family N-acetyltransferase [Duganella fentianensis]
MKIVETEQELRACYPVMKELRPHLASEQAFVEQMLRQREQHYRILAKWDGAEVVALAGYRLQENTVYGRFLYVDDLVAAPAHRCRRWGALLLSQLTVLAQQAGCTRLHPAGAGYGAGECAGAALLFPRRAATGRYALR